MTDSPSDEYKILHGRAAKVEKQVNELAAQGWEFVAFACGSGGFGSMFLFMFGAVVTIILKQPCVRVDSPVDEYKVLHGPAVKIERHLNERVAEGWEIVAVASGTGGAGSWLVFLVGAAVTILRKRPRAPER